MLEFGDVLCDVADHFLHKGALLPLLLHHEFPLALLADLKKRVHRHLLHSREGLVHELEQLEDHRLEELPMGPQEPRVLPDDVHDVAGDHGLVLLAALHLAQAQEVPNDGDQEPLLVALVHRAADGADGPAQAIQHRGRPVLGGALHQALLLQPVQHNGLHVVGVQMRQINQCLPDHLVQRDFVRVLLLRAHDVALLVLLDGHLRRLGHLGNQHAADLRKHGAVVLHLGSGGVGCRVAAGSGAHGAVEEQRRRVAGGARLLAAALLDLEENPCAECLPELHANLECLLVRTHGDPHEVLQRRDHVRLLGLHGAHVVPQEACEQQGHLVVEHLPEDLLRPRQRRARLRHVFGELLDLLNDALEATDQLRLVLLHALVQARDLVEALRALDAVLQRVPEVHQQCRDQVRLENVTQGNPFQEVRQGRQRGGHQGRLDGAGTGNVALENEIAQLVDGRELRVQGVLEDRHLAGHHVVLPEVEHLLAQQVEDPEVVLAQGLVGL
mmetsp:Transcript_45937/g.139255  ORF Transcript_45937/g.139255 Transcript_45937/m.139255 type:complete len:499 (-) Transcript_45937:491-1987(-)